MVKIEMSSSILEQRRQTFQAWNAALSRARTFPPNPRHDLPRHDRDYASIPLDVTERPIPPDEAALDIEIAAWEQASDDDFEQFEQSLE